MESVDNSISELVQHLQTNLFGPDGTVCPETVLTVPLKHDFFSEGLLDSFRPEISKLSIAKRELVIKRALNDLLATVGDTNVAKVCVLLDFCYQLKFCEDEEDSKAWASLFFDLTASCILGLAFPHELLDFYLYLDSRLRYFLEGLSKHPVATGETNLKMGIRPPVAKLFFSIDNLLKNLDSHSILATPKQYELVHKLLWWVSQLIPINDHCNINRKASIMNEYPESFWAPHLPAVPKLPNILSDWVVICDELFLHPLHWIFSHPKDKMIIEPILHRFIDEVITIETEYYSMLKNKNEKTIKQQAIVNGKEFYPLNFPGKRLQEPKDSSSTILPTKVDFWKDFDSISRECEDITQMLPLELDLFDLKSFQDRIEAFDYTYFRKMIILQIYLTLYLLRAVLSTDALSQYYGKIFKQTDHSSKLRLDHGNNAMNKNDSVIKTLDKKIKRITTFYEKSDKNFSTLLSSLAKNELSNLLTKTTDFANMRDISWSSKEISKPQIDQSFKKFGWIKLGNKKLDNVWKIMSGLDLAKTFAESNRKNPEELYASIISGKQPNNSNTNAENEDDVDSAIVKQWQTLRSLRYNYLFHFNRVNEKTTLSGFADAELIELDRKAKHEKLKQREEAKRQVHLQAVAVAEKYFQDKEQQKKQLEEKIQADKEASEAEASTLKRERPEPESGESTFEGEKGKKQKPESPPANTDTATDEQQAQKSQEDASDASVQTPKSGSPREPTISASIEPDAS